MSKVIVKRTSRVPARTSTKLKRSDAIKHVRHLAARRSTVKKEGKKT
jgi:hypothetical protein